MTHQQPSPAPLGPEPEIPESRKPARIRPATAAVLAVTGAFAGAGAYFALVGRWQSGIPLLAIALVLGLIQLVWSLKTKRSGRD